VGGGGGGGGTISASQSAQNLENALFTSCGSTITADYRKRYRLLAMGIRVCPSVRAAIARGALTPATLIGMPCVALEAYGKPSPSKKQAPPLSTGGGAAAAGKVGDAGAAGVKVEVKEEGGAGARAALPQQSVRAVKVAPLKAPSLLPEVKRKVEQPSRSPSPERPPVPPPPALETTPGDAHQTDPAQRGAGGGHGEAAGGERRDSGLELAIVGEVCWVGSLCKAESNTQVWPSRPCIAMVRLRSMLCW